MLVHTQIRPGCSCSADTVTACWLSCPLQAYAQPACRCRYLEETGCASICINSCKLPTQEFFAQDMGLPLTMVQALLPHDILHQLAGC